MTPLAASFTYGQKCFYPQEIILIPPIVQHSSTTVPAEEE